MRLIFYSDSGSQYLKAEQSSGLKIYEGSVIGKPKFSSSDEKLTDIRLDVGTLK